MTSQKILRSFGTHSGTFHADEVTACALLLFFQLIDEDKIVRTREPAVLEKCEYVCDVGGIYDPERKLFDHHQAEYQDRLSSAGMVLQYLKGQGYLTDKEYDFFNRTLIWGIDDHDNGRAPEFHGICTFSHVIANFTPIVYEASAEQQDANFREAMRFVLGHLKRSWERYHYIQSCRQTVVDCMKRSQECLIFDQGIPWIETFFELNGGEHPALFVIMPSGDHWKLRAIPPSLDERMKVRQPLPKEWAGLRDDRLRRVSGISGAIFCHKGRFISVWETKADALKALEYIVNEIKKENK
jgi:uncharacterized UPF0160 family protein